MTIGARIKEARLRRGLTQGQLALAIKATSNMAVSRWERGEWSPERQWLAPLAKVLGVPVQWLLDGDEESAANDAAPVLPDEVLALCDAMGVRRPDDDEARWLLTEPQFHRRTAVAVIDVLRMHRNGVVAEETTKHLDVSVPKRKR